MKHIIFLSIYLYSSIALADYTLSTTVENVSIGQNHQKTGSLQVTLTSNVFNQATPESPTYFKISFSNGVPMSQTRVDILGGSESSEPIYLALQTPTAQLNIPEDAVSIVRWRINEPEIWLKINHPSTTWVNNQGQLEPPSLDNPVSLQIGITEEETIQRNQVKFQNGLANLPYNRRNNEPVDTSFLLNLESAELNLNGEFISIIDPIIVWEGIGITTEPNHNDIQIIKEGIIFVQSHPIAFAIQAVPGLGTKGLLLLSLSLILYTFLYMKRN